MEMEYNCIETVRPAYQEKRNVVTVFDNLKNEHLIRVNKMSPNEIFMFLINPPNKKSENQKMIAKHVFKETRRKPKSRSNMCLCVCNYRYF